MEPISQLPGTVKGLEVLYFEQAEIQKIKGSTPSFAASGPLQVLYFKDYSRFALRLNDVIYPLLRRLSISSSTGKDDATSRTYILPAMNGCSFTLYISAPSNTQALSNLDTIFEHNCRFISKGQESLRKVEASPDDKVTRHQHKSETGIKEVISETFKHVVKTVENKTATLKTGTKYLTSTKRRLNPKDIKNKNFKKEATSTIKKDFFKSSEKISNEFLKMRKDNLNLTQLKEFSDLSKSSNVPTLYLMKDEVEEAILRNKEILSYALPLDKPMGEARERVSGMMGRDRNVIGQEMKTVDKMPISGGLAHDLA